MKAPSLPFGSNLLGENVLLQFRIILAKMCCVVKPDLGNPPAAIFYCCDLLPIV